MPAVDVDAIIQRLRRTLGEGSPPSWPTPPFGGPVPPASQWEGQISDAAHNSSTHLNNERNKIAQTHAALGPLIDQAGQIITHARTQLDNVAARWQADKSSLQPLSHTVIGRTALLEAGAARVQEATAAVHSAQAQLSSLAAHVQALTNQIPQSPGPDNKASIRPVDFKDSPPQDPNEPPQPGGGYGSYHYGYQFSTREGWTKEQIMAEIQQHFNNYFTFTADKDELVNGAKLNLKGPLGEDEPVQVTSLTPDSFSFVSLPGHNEGTGRIINFSIVPSAASPVPGRLTWELRVAASGPLSKGSLIPGASLMNKGIWQIFADNLDSRLPTLPPVLGRATV